MIYKELRKQVEDWSGNTTSEFLDSVNGFIHFAEDRVGMLVKLPAYTRRTTIATVAANQFIDLSAVPGFISVNHLTLDGYGNIDQKDTSFLKEAYPDSGEQGIPRFFAMQNDLTLAIGPTPDIIYTLDLDYFGKWPSLVTLGSDPTTANTETFISSKFGAALLSASMMYANLWMKDPAAVKSFGDEMMANLGLIDKFGKGSAKVTNNEMTNAGNSAGDSN